VPRHHSIPRVLCERHALRVNRAALERLFSALAAERRRTMFAMCLWRPPGPAHLRHRSRADRGSRGHARHRARGRRRSPPRTPLRRASVEEIVSRTSGRDALQADSTSSSGDRDRGGARGRLRQPGGRLGERAQARAGHFSTRWAGGTPGFSFRRLRARRTPRRSSPSPRPRPGGDLRGPDRLLAGAAPRGAVGGRARAGPGKLWARAKLRRATSWATSPSRSTRWRTIEHLVRGQRELLANVSHELRTPLARIRVALDLAAEGSAQDAAPSCRASRGTSPSWNG